MKFIVNTMVLLIQYNIILYIFRALYKISISFVLILDGLI